MSGIDLAAAERMIGLLEALLAEQRGIAQQQSDALAHHAQALAVQQAMNRQALKWFCTFILVFGAVAAITRAWPALVWLSAAG